MLNFVLSLVSLINPWLWALVAVVLAALIGSRLKVPVLVDLWTELAAVAALLWGQFKANVLVLAIAGFLLLFDQRLFVITLAVVAVVIAVGDKVNQVVQSIKPPKA